MPLWIIPGIPSFGNCGAQSFPKRGLLAHNLQDEAQKSAAVVNCDSVTTFCASRAG